MESPQASVTDMRRHRVMTTVAVMAATVMQVLDTTIVNVALPQMAGQLSATPDQISWVLTSYLVSSGIVMLLTGFFADRLGQKRYLLISIIGFTVTSALCGLAGSLFQIVLFRLLQGVFGAALVPLSQSIMVQTFPHEERGKAMAIWGMGVMVGPILGPTLGGWLTEVLDWRWTFFINLPVGIFSALLAWRVVAHTETRRRDVDWIGLLLLGAAIGGLQYVLDRGNQDDWFNSRTIALVAAISVAGFIGFLLHSLRNNPYPILDPAIFRDRNFATSSLLLGVFGLGLFGNLLLQPLMLENLFDYPALTTGFMLAPRGLASMISMMVVGKLIRHSDPRILISVGVIIFTAGSYGTTLYNLNISLFWVVWPAIVQGFGLGLIFVPLSTVAFSTLPPRHAAEAAGIYSLLRTIGSGIGVSIVATLMARHTQIAWNHLGGHINAYNPSLEHYLAPLQLEPQSALSPLLLAHELGRQAQMIGILDAYEMVMWSFVMMLPLVFLMRHQRAAGTAQVPVKAEQE
jgi:DHA2 family multidrug resistance protein